MTIEDPRMPKDVTDLFRLHDQLTDEFAEQGLVLEIESEFMGLHPDGFGFNVDDPEAGVNWGFLLVIFDEKGWAVVVPQNPWGKKSVEALFYALGRDPFLAILEPFETDVAEYHTYVPYEYEPPKPSHLLYSY